MKDNKEYLRVSFKESISSLFLEKNISDCYLTLFEEVIIETYMPYYDEFVSFLFFLVFYKMIFYYKKKKNKKKTTCIFLENVFFPLKLKFEIFLFSNLLHLAELWSEKSL